MNIRFHSFFAVCLGSSLFSLPTCGTVDVSRFCEVLIVSEGWFEANNVRKFLSSNQVGGKSGVAQIRSSRNLRGSLFRISAETPLGFDIAPPELRPDVEFSTSHLNACNVHIVAEARYALRY